MRKLLLVAPDKKEFQGYLRALEEVGFTMTYEENERRVRERVVKESYAGVLIMYQQKWYKCFQICEVIKKISNVPICIISAYQDEVDAISFLQKNILYIPLATTPNFVAHFMKAISNAYRELQFTTRGKPNQEVNEQENSCSIGKILVLDSVHKVFIENKEVDLTGYPYEILKYLMKKSPNIVPCEELYQEIWRMPLCNGYERTVRVAINKIRKTLDINRVENSHIENIRKEGYRFI